MKQISSTLILTILLTAGLLTTIARVDAPPPAAVVESVETTEVTEAAETEAEADTETEETESNLAPAMKLKDQFGMEHELTDYIGKVVFLNFWATWCGPCQVEMPDIQAAYEKYGENQEDVIILGVAAPFSEGNTLTMEGTTEEVIAYLADNDYTYPSLLDESGLSFVEYGIYSIPMTYMIAKDGSLYGVKRGLVTPADIDRMIEMTREAGD